MSVPLNREEVLRYWVAVDLTMADPDAGRVVTIVLAPVEPPIEPSIGFTIWEDIWDDIWEDIWE